MFYLCKIKDKSGNVQRDTEQGSQEVVSAESVPKVSEYNIS